MLMHFWGGGFHIYPNNIKRFLCKPTGARGGGDERQVVAARIQGIPCVLRLAAHQWVKTLSHQPLGTK